MDEDRLDPELDPATAPAQAVRRRGRSWLVAPVVVALVAAGAAVAWWVTREHAGPLVFPGLGQIVSEKVTLYFADPRWTRLVPEERRLAPASDAIARVRSLVAALAEGPRVPESAPVLPKATKVRGVYLGREGLAVVDLENLAGFDPGGASGEALAVFSLVQTITQNVPGLTAVQFLVGGQELETLAGHVKISEPLRPDSQWLGTAQPQ